MNAPLQNVQRTLLVPVIAFSLIVIGGVALLPAVSSCPVDCLICPRKIPFCSVPVPKATKGPFARPPRTAAGPGRCRLPRPQHADSGSPAPP